MRMKMTLLGALALLLSGCGMNAEQQTLADEINVSLEAIEAKTEQITTCAQRLMVDPKNGGKTKACIDASTGVKDAQSAVARIIKENLNAIDDGTLANAMRVMVRYGTANEALSKAELGKLGLDLKD